MAGVMEEGDIRSRKHAERLWLLKNVEYAKYEFSSFNEYSDDKFRISISTQTKTTLFSSKQKYF